MGKKPATTVVEKAELAQSYIAQLQIFLSLIILISYQP